MPALPTLATTTVSSDAASAPSPETAQHRPECRVLQAETAFGFTTMKITVEVAAEATATTITATTTTTPNYPLEGKDNEGATIPCDEMAELEEEDRKYQN